MKVYAPPPIAPRETILKAERSGGKREKPDFAALPRKSMPPPAIAPREAILKAGRNARKREKTRFRRASARPRYLSHLPPR